MYYVTLNPWLVVAIVLWLLSDSLARIFGFVIADLTRRKYAAAPLIVPGFAPGESPTDKALERMLSLLETLAKDKGGGEGWRGDAH